MIALVAGLVIALLFQAPDLMTMGYVASLGPNPFSPNVISYRAGELASVPLLFAAIAIAVTSYKAGLRRSILNLLGAFIGALGISSVIVYAAIAFAANRPPKELPFADAGASRTGFVKGMSDSCAQKQKTLPGNNTVPAAIEAFCSCFGNALADVATKADVASLAQRQAPPGWVEKVNAASQKCVRLAQGQQ